MTELIGIAAVAVVAWFAAGTIWNVRTGRELMRWMQDGLPLLGSRTTVRWLGSTAVEMVIGDARSALHRRDAGDLPRTARPALVALFASRAAAATR